MTGLQSKPPARRPPTTLGVQSSGGSTVDPTQNLKDLTEAANLRQDDLRELNDRRIEAEIRVIQTQVACVKEMSSLRAEHDKEIRLLESDRLDKIRQVDVLAGNTAAERALVAIQTLATQTTAERETLRNLVATTATTIATQNTADLARINEQISALQKSSYESAGKQTYVDPMMAELVKKMEQVITMNAGTAGQGAGAKNLWGIIIAVLVALVGFGGMLIAGVGLLLRMR